MSKHKVTIVREIVQDIIVEAKDKYKAEKEALQHRDSIAVIMFCKERKMQIAAEYCKAIKEVDEEHGQIKRSSTHKN